MSTLATLSREPDCRARAVHRASDSSSQKDALEAKLDTEKPGLVDPDEQEECDPCAPKAVERPWKHKGPALALIIFLTLGSNFAQSSLGPLKSTIRKEVPGVTNARYGAIASADALINGILPILTGIVIDYYGPSGASLVASTCILVGCVVRAIGGSTASFSTILGGQIIFGLGSTTIETCQSKLYTHWGRGTVNGGAGILGFIYGLDIAMGRVFNLAGRLSSVPIAEGTGKWFWTFWVGAILAAVTLVLNIVYVIFERTLPEDQKVMTGHRVARMLEQRSKAEGIDGGDVVVLSPLSTTYWKTVVASVFAIPAAFWLVTMSQVLQSGTVGAYSSNLAEASRRPPIPPRAALTLLSQVVEVTRGTTRLTAGYTSSLSQVIPIILTPIIGLGFDRFGHRMHVVTFTASLWVLVFGLLAYSSVHPMVPVILGSVALASNAIPFIASIPLLAPSQACIGTAFGVWKAFNSAGSTIVDVAAGAIQDRTPTGSNQYNNVFYFLIAMKGIDVIYGLIYNILDKRYFGGVLKANERRRMEQESKESPDDLRQGLRAPKRSWTIAGLTLASAMIVTSYVIYIVYSIGT